MNRTLWKAQFFLTPEQPADHPGQLLLTEHNFLIYSYIFGGKSPHTAGMKSVPARKVPWSAIYYNPKLWPWIKTCTMLDCSFLNDREKKIWKTLPYKPQLLDTAVQSHRWTQSTLKALNAISSLDRHVSEGCHNPYTHLDQLLHSEHAALSDN